MNNGKQECAYIRMQPKRVLSFYKLVWDGVCIKERKGPGIQVPEVERWWDDVTLHSYEGVCRCVKRPTQKDRTKKRRNHDN